ncbi:MAG: sensor histidine kinase [Candidatus Cyclobacteriaceae bacterium M2_1C_046]
MDFKDFKTSLLLRVGLLTATIFYFVWLIIGDGFFVIQLVVFGLFGLQVIALIKYLERSHEELLKFLNSFKEEDLSFHYQDSGNTELLQLQKEFNKILKKLRGLKDEKEAEFQYLKNIVQHVGIGLITFDSTGNVQIINTAAKKLLKINRLENVKELESVNPLLVDILFRLKTGGRDLIRLTLGEDVIQLAVYAIELTLRGDEFKLISLQNIHSELEEKEMEAWQNLVRVLTHEIMNSVTPITSLANTVEEELAAQLKNDQDVNALSNEEIEDLHLAVKTIKKRGQGLNRFVQDFRNLAHIPEPKTSEIKVSELYDEILLLLKQEIAVNEVQVNKSLNDGEMVISADKELIEQVLINLIKNAIQAFEEETHKLIEVGAHYDEKGHPVLTVKDNGSGIEPEALEKIFIPFFTTKKTGSGIGLSLSRQIMRKHGGVLGVKSKIDEGTEFFLKF